MTPDELEYYNERAAIMEYDGGLDRETAELHAYCEMVNRFRNIETTGLENQPRRG